MSSIPCALVVAFLVSVALAAPTTTTTTAATTTPTTTATTTTSTTTATTTTTTPTTTAAAGASTTTASATSTANSSLLDSMGIGQSLSFGDLGQFVIVFGVSPCMASCMDNMRQVFNSSNTEDDERHVTVDFQEICDNYFSAATCFRMCPEGDGHLFDVITAGANYMCVEQRHAFERAMPCIEKEKKALNQECSQQCATPQKSVQEAGLNEEDSTDDVPTTISSQPSNSSDPLVVIAGLCDTLHCSIGCNRDFLNKHCDKDLHAGNLVTEVILRVLEKNSEFMQEQLSPEQAETISEALPPSCMFLADEEQLDELRDGWEPEDDSKDFKAQGPSSSTSLPASTTEHVRQRRSYSSSNRFASAGVFASHAMTFFM